MTLQVTIGVGVDRPHARRITIKTEGGCVLALQRLFARLSAEVEGWIAGSVFEGDYRRRDRWESQWLLGVDVDHYDADGNHVPLTQEARDAIQFAIDNELLPGCLVHLTPRGFRIWFALSEPTTDPDQALRAHRGAVALVARVMPLKCLRVDVKTSVDICRLMFLPNAVVKGKQRHAMVEVLREDCYEIDELCAHAQSKSAAVTAAPSTGKLPHYIGAVLEHLNVNDYQTWVDVGMGLKFSFGEQAFEVWDEWSTRSDKYPGREDARSKWNSFQRTGGVVATFDSVRRAARASGWSGGDVFDTLPEPPPRPKGDGSLVLRCMADVKPTEIDWLWENRFPIGRISLLSGAPGAAKSYFTHYMSACISQGRDWCDGAPCEQGSVVLVSCEDDPGDTVRRRLDACGADVRRIHIVEGVRRIDPRSNKKSVTVFTIADITPLDEALVSMPDARLVVVDPIGSYFGGKKDAHVDTEVRALLMPLAALARAHGVAMLIVAHTRKASGGSADDGVLGSRGFTGMARTVHHLFRDPAARERRLLLPGKSNVGVEKDGLAFRLVGVPIPEVVFETGPVKQNADDMAQQLARRGSSGQEREPRGASVDWLREVLRAGLLSATDVKEMAAAAGLQWRTVQRAAQDLRVRPQRNGFAGGGWTWALPADPELDELLS